MSTWLITGCSSGLGRALAVHALDLGHKVVATARDPRQLEDLVGRYPGRAVDAYADTAGKRRKENAGAPGEEPGDPDRAADLIVRLASIDQLPFRMPMGSDAVSMIRDHLRHQLNELDQWSDLSTTTDRP
ncbi:hypothetical protein EV643_103388 [Kribbella sp. VKM Ac-2527]|uniref:Short subunit dehydrogenase n=1 Tax=Kribbella caucasensis TaxID=2512215 RepID=A0A4R6KPW6_9ACTN|nr:hypothetical protein [Kribbella sp. VKM Ac-2527]TDO51649.1 hypothetical protein EV643_103388 [Kribbella sp. VKM Ac-2527]